MNLPEGYQRKFQGNPAAENNRAGKPRNDWEEQLDMFAAKLNPDRIKADFRPYSQARIAKLLSNAGVHDGPAAYRFYKTIETKARNFGKLFDFLTRAHTKLRVRTGNRTSPCQRIAHRLDI